MRRRGRDQQNSVAAIACSHQLALTTRPCASALPSRYKTCHLDCVACGTVKYPDIAQYQYNEEHGFETCMGFLLILRHVRYDFWMTVLLTVSHGPEVKSIGSQLVGEGSNPTTIIEAPGQTEAWQQKPQAKSITFFNAEAWIFTSFISRV